MGADGATPCRLYALGACAEAKRRASQTLEWALSVPNASLLDIALDHLARALIEQHRYWRRREELEDAEGVASDW